MFQESGKWISLRPQRVMMSDLMHLAKQVPSVPVQRRMRLRSLIEARRNANPRPAWCLLFTKAFSLVAEESPDFRRAYLQLPWDHLYQHPLTIACIVVEQVGDGESDLAIVRLRNPSRYSLRSANRKIRCAQQASDSDVWMARFSRWSANWLWRPIRRGLGWLAFNASGRFRAEHFGTVCVSSYSGLGSESLHPLSPLSFFLNYGVIDENGEVDVRIVYDHRVLDGATVARALTSMEHVLLGPIRQELEGMAQPPKSSA